MKRGRPPRFGPAARELVCRVTKTAPHQLGRPFTTCLTTLVEYLGEAHRLVVSTSTVRVTLREADQLAGDHDMAGDHDVEGQP